MPSILVDNNLSVLTLEVLSPHFPNSNHVSQLGMNSASDTVIWNLARRDYSAILTKDKDFYHRVIANGPPPKLIWITRGNCRNKELLNLIRDHLREIELFILSEREILNIS